MSEERPCLLMRARGLHGCAKEREARAWELRTFACLSIKESVNLVASTMYEVPTARNIL